MVFSTLTFLFCFLPLVVILYYIGKNRTWRNGVLLVFSLLFYAWGEPKFLLVMLAASLTAYIGGLLIHRFSEFPKLRKTVFVVTVCLLTANLFVFKYLNFTADNLSLLFGKELAINLALPIGISFYTFQILSYVIDLYRGEIQLQRNFFWLTLYVTFFPQLIAGPIVRYQTVEKEIRCRRETLDDAACGLRRLIIGLAKKVILANQTGAIAAAVYGGDPAVFGPAMYWLAALAYTLQIYFDFSGYSDMAIGLGQIFGFHFLENFRYPYVACSITDFWRRWHISLSTWFRDYIYIPLGGNRVSRRRWLLNLCIVWALTGFWHGAQWNFLLWGLYYAVLLIAEKLVLHRLLDKLPKAVQWLYTFLLVMLGWVLFNATSLADVGMRLSGMFTPSAATLIDAVAADSTLLYSLLFVPLGIVCMLPWKEWITIPKGPCSTMVQNMVCLFLLLLCVIFILGSTYNPFIYFRF